MASEVFSAREGGVNPINTLNRSSNVARPQAQVRRGASEKITKPKAGKTTSATVNGINYNISHERTEGGTGHFRVADAEVGGHYMDYYYGRGHIDSQSAAWKRTTAWMQSSYRKANRTRQRRQNEENARIRESLRNR